MTLHKGLILLSLPYLVRRYIKNNLWNRILVSTLSNYLICMFLSLSY